jgi:hypothetical protein
MQVFTLSPTKQDTLAVRRQLKELYERRNAIESLIASLESYASKEPPHTPAPPSAGRMNRAAS